MFSFLYNNFDYIIAIIFAVSATLYFIHTDIWNGDCGPISKSTLILFLVGMGLTIFVINDISLDYHRLIHYSYHGNDFVINVHFILLNFYIYLNTVNYLLKNESVFNKYKFFWMYLLGLTTSFSWIWLIIEVNLYIFRFLSF